jgi:aspartyl-tRNA(Asn)/glutamyl-tRNA(Gln) amidotransferase subunit C
MSETSVDPETVRHVADQFSEVLSYFDTLDEVPEVEREAELTNVMRPDEEREGLSREEALQNAPETEDGYFTGPRVS